MALSTPNAARRRVVFGLNALVQVAVAAVLVVGVVWLAGRLNWQADVIVVGSIASLASRLLGSVTQKLTNAFFNCVKAKIEA